MKNTTRKAFTIVELVIVIAILAVLAAVLVPTFVNLIKVAHVSSDTQLVRNLNTALAVDNQEHKTMQSALDAAAAAGYDVGKINATATGNEILWDSANDLFCYLEADAERPIYIPESTLTISNPTDVQYWRITGEDKYLRGSDAKYSVYYTGNSTEIITTVGFDAGTTTGITSVTYTGSSAQEVVISTNSFDTEVIVNSTEGEVRHYGKAKSVDIRQVAMASYYEHGELLGKITLAKGHVVLESTANASVIEVTAENAADISIDIPESKSIVVTATNSGVVSAENVKGAIIPASDDVICSFTTKQCYSSMEEAIAAGGKLVLLCDYTDSLTSDEFVLAGAGVTVEMDLNGYMLTSSNRQMTVYGSLTLKGNGKIISKLNKYALFVNENAELIIDAGNDFVLECNNGISTDKSGSVILTGGTYRLTENSQGIAINIRGGNVELTDITVNVPSSHGSSGGIVLTSCDKAVLNNVKVSTQGGHALWVQSTICEVNGGEFETNGQSIDGTSARTYSSTIYVAYGSLDIHGARIKYVKYGIEKHDLVENLSSNNNTFIQLENHDSDSADISPD